MADETVAVISDGAWLANTAYSLGDTVSNDSLKIYKCITAGTSAASGGPTGTGSDITDNTAHWAYQATVGAAYTSLNAAFSGESADLVTNTCILTIDCYAFDDTTGADQGTSWIVSSSYYVNIVAHDSHEGKWSESAYRRTHTSVVLSIQESYTRITGIQIADNRSLTGGDDLSSQYAAGPVYWNRCIFKSLGLGSTTVKGCSVYTADGVGNFYNCLFYDFNYRGIFNSYRTVNVYNCTFANITDTGIEDLGGTSTVKNCLFSGCTTDASGLDTCEYCSTTNDNTKGIPTATGNRHSQTFSFVDSDNDDWHLESNDAGAKDYGIDLSAIFTDDIDGETRPTGAGTWDIGADEYISSVIVGTTCWGHSTGATETNKRTFTDNWTGIGSITGSGDDEQLEILGGQYMESEVVNTNGTQTVTVQLNKYGSGDSCTVKYRTGATSDLSAVSWSTYSAPFESSGYIQVRLEEA